MALPTGSLPIIPPVTAAASTPRAAVAGLAVALASALAFSASGPLVKPLLEGGWSTGAALLVRMGVAALVLSPALWRAARRERAFFRTHGGTILAFGLTAVAGCQLFYFSAMQRMPVAVALLIQYLAPVLLVGWAWVRTRTAPSRLVIAGSIVAIAGLVLVVDIAGARVDPIGVLLALGAAVCTGAYFLIAARSGDALPPLALASGGLFTGALVIGVLCLAGILPFEAPAINVVVGGVELPWFVPLLTVAAVGTTLGYGLGVMAVPMIGSRVASFVGLSEVLFALGFAWLLLGEAPAPIQIVGGALIIAGVILVRMDRSTEPEATARLVPVTAARVPGP